VTGDDSAKDKEKNSYYIPPTAGPAVKEKPLPEIKKAEEDWSALAIIVFGLIILVAGFQLFIIVMQLINAWIADQFVPVLTAAVDVIIIVGGIWLIRNYLQKK
jgi:hypothetical protein